MKSKISVIILISVQSFSFLAQSPPNYVATDDLQAWWSFQGNATDLSQNNHDGIVYDVDFLDDYNSVSENSAFFKGTSSSYIKVNHSSKLNFTGTDDYTIAMWINVYDNPDNGPHSGILTKWDENQHTTSYPYRIATTDLGDGTSELFWVNYHYGSGTQNILSTIVTNNRYVHIVFVAKNNTVSLYKNGYFESSLFFDNLSYSNSDDIYIGKRNLNNNRRYHGFLDEMGIWNRALSECEIAALATHGSIYDLELSITNNDGTLTAESSSTDLDSFKWFECVNDTTQNLISGADSSSYTPDNIQGYYAVEAYSVGFNCPHNSGCIDVETLDLKYIDANLETSIILLYPNPSYKHLNFEILSENEIGELDYKIIDMTGKIMQKGMMQKGLNVINIHELNKGNYFFQLPQLSKSIKFVKS